MNVRRLLATLVALTLLAAACGDGDDGEVDATGGATALEGVIQLTAGECTDAGGTSGTYFRMVQPDGTVEEGPYVENGDSPCGDITFTPLAPGTDGGLVLGEHQPNPDPAFDDDGHGLASAIVEPAPFFAVQFAVSTNPTDPQTGNEAPAPTLTAADGTVSGDLAALAASWNEQHFNQGAPKPDGSTPGATTLLTGTYDAATKKFVMEWTSTIVGGPFDNFTGKWHFEGTFEPAAAETPVTPPATAAGTSGAGGSDASALPAASTASGTTAGQAAGTGLTPRTGAPWSSALPASLLLLALAGRRLSRRPEGPGTPRTPGSLPEEG